MLQPLRESRQWTQQHLADIAGVSLRTIQRMEAGEGASKETLMAVANAFGVDSISPDDGPHVVLTPDTPEILPGCRVLVFKDGWRVPCVTRLDSRARTVTRYGMLLLDFPFDEIEKRVSFKGGHPRTFFVEEGDELPDGAQDGCFIIKGRHYYYKPDSILVDGEPWDGREHPRTFHYDAVIVQGPYKALFTLDETLNSRVPKHWVKMPTDRPGETSEGRTPSG